MVEKIRIRLARMLAKNYIEELESSADRRFALLVSKMDPFKPFFDKFGGVFSRYHERPENGLDEKAALSLEMFGWKLRDDPCWIYIYNWMQDRHGQDLIKRGNPTADNILYSRSLMTNMILLDREFKRLGGLYEDRLHRPPEFDTTVTVD